MLASILHGGPIPLRKDSRAGKSPRAAHVASRSFGSPGKANETLFLHRLEARSSQELDGSWEPSSGLDREHASQFWQLSEALLAKLRDALTNQSPISQEDVTRDLCGWQDCYDRLPAYLQDHFRKLYDDVFYVTSATLALCCGQGHIDSTEMTLLGTLNEIQNLLASKFVPRKHVPSSLNSLVAERF